MVAFNQAMCFPQIIHNTALSVHYSMSKYTKDADIGIGIIKTGDLINHWMDVGPTDSIYAMVPESWILTFTLV